MRSLRTISGNKPYLEVFINNVTNEDETKIPDALRELLDAKVIELAHKELRTLCEPVCSAPLMKGGP